MGNREPNRDDLIQAPANTSIQPERLLNTELGWHGQFKKAQLGVNFYQMTYKNQLALTGQINDVGEAIRVNVPQSYRNGIELEVMINICKPLIFNANAAFSQNKIKNFTERIDNWDTGSQDMINRGKTNLAFSPNAILNGELMYNFIKNDKHEASISWSTKYVGKQYIDNTSNENTALSAYAYSDVKLFYTTHFKFIKKLTCKLLINNILNHQYTNNAWTYRFNSAGYDPRPDDSYARLEQGSTYNLTGYFPQAGRNVMVGISVDF